MNIKLLAILTLTLLSTINDVHGQYCEDDKEHDRKKVDTNVRSIKDYFLHGSFGGHLRNFYMLTVNDSKGEDHYANALGGSLSYSTATWKGIHFGVKGIFTYNLFSSQLSGNDSTIRPAKWEQELFDVTHPSKVDDLDRLEELYIAFDNEQLHAKAGKIDINDGPLLRRWDGRMKPFVYKGAWSKWSPKEHITLYNGFVSGVSPRGMTEWYSINEAVGILSRGHLNDSTEMDYHEHSNSRGLSVNAVDLSLKKINIEFWNYYIHHIYNTSWIQVKAPVKKWSFGGQYVFQVADQHQNKLDEYKQYFHPGTSSHTLSLEVGYKFTPSLSLRAAHTEILGSAPFLFPKELGRDQLFTSVSRSRMDGLGKTNTSLLEAHYSFKERLKKDLSIITSIQYMDTPMCDDHQLNKYRVPDYTQFNFRLRHNFHKALEGMHINFLYVFRYSHSQQMPELTDEYYKTNLHHFSLVFDVVF